MSDHLTPKQSQFAQKYVELGNASEAYRQSYDAENMSPEAIRVEACRLLQHPRVALMVVNLQEGHSKRHLVTVDSLTAEYEEVRILALVDKQYAPANGAITGKAKIHGKIVDKNEHTGKDGTPLPSTVMLTVTENLVKSIMQQVREDF